MTTTVSDLGLIFDEDPDLYDRARPGYPGAVFADLRERAGLGPGCRVVEIGAGTGQATRSLLAAGARVTAVGPGDGLARVLLASRDPGLTVVVSRFEDWAATRPMAADAPGGVDIVAAFTAWHWLEPGRRVDLAARLLRTGGALATVTTEHVAGGTTAFFAQAQRCYERWMPGTPPGLILAPSDSVPAGVDEVDTSPWFDPAVRTRHEQSIRYTTQEYLDVLATYSNHRALGERAREGLFGCLRRLIDGGYGGVCPVGDVEALPTFVAGLDGELRCDPVAAR